MNTIHPLLFWTHFTAVKLAGVHFHVFSSLNWSVPATWQFQSAKIKNKNRTMALRNKYLSYEQRNLHSHNEEKTCSKVNTSSISDRKIQTRKDKNKQKNRKQTAVWTKVPVSTLVQGPSAPSAVSMCDNDTSERHQPVNWVSAANPEATGRLSHTTG